MTHEVLNYELPSSATRLDRYTLAVWKLWLTWLLPMIVAVVVMGVVSAVAGTVIAGRGGYVAPWSPVNYAAVASVDGAVSEFNEGAWARGLIAQAVATLLAAAALWPFLRRWRSPVAVAVAAGFVVTAIHLTVSHQWSLEPIGAAGTAWNLWAVVALWCLPVVAGAFARLMSDT